MISAIKIFHDDCFENHVTGAGHPESPSRLRAILARLGHRDDLSGAPTDVSPSILRDVHSQGQIDLARKISLAGGGLIDADTVLSHQSWDVALRAAGSAVAATDAVLTGAVSRALCLVRPPGHHASHVSSSGFCIFNNVALAARHAQKAHSVGRVLIVDWDVHHGNGTQDIFWSDPSVFFLSVHRWPFYPGTGSAEETGTGAGLGFTKNVPLPAGTGRQRYIEAFNAALESAAAKIRPELIIISAGFDAHRADPIGSLGLESEDFATLTRSVVETANTWCKGRIVSCLEGGYNLTALGESVRFHADSLAV